MQNLLEYNFLAEKSIFLLWNYSLIIYKELSNLKDGRLQEYTPQSGNPVHVSYQYLPCIEYKFFFISYHIQIYKYPVKGHEKKVSTS